MSICGLIVDGKKRNYHVKVVITSPGGIVTKTTSNLIVL